MHLFLPYLSCWCIYDNEYRTKKYLEDKWIFSLKHVTWVSSTFLLIVFFSIDLFNTVKGNIVSNECTCASAATTIVQPYLFCQFWFLCVLIGCGERNFFCYRKEKLYFLLCNIYSLWKLLYFKHFFNIFMGKWYISKQW